MLQTVLPRGKSRESGVSHHQGRAPGLVTKVEVLPPMGERHQPREELEKTKEAEVANVHQA